MEQCDILSKYNKKILANFYKAFDYIYGIAGEYGERKNYTKMKETVCVE